MLGYRNFELVETIQLLEILNYKNLDVMTSILQL